MAGREHGTPRLKSCWNYRKELREPYPVIRVKLYNAALEEFGPVELQVDTGYEGPVMLPSDDYSFFMVGELPRSMWRTYRTLTGIVTMRVAHAIVEVNGLRLETYVESPLYGGGRRLVGRELLNKIRLLLDGPRRRSCLVEG